MPDVTLRQASLLYGNFYVPRFEISAAGAGLPQDVVRDIVQVTYNDSTTDIDSFDITVNNWDPQRLEFKYVGAEDRVDGGTPRQRLFNPGAHEFELKLGYGNQLKSIVKGYSASLEPSFPAAGAPTLTVRALNVLQRLRMKRHRDQWPNDRVSRAQVKASKVAQDIGQRSVGGCRFPLPIRVDSQAAAAEPVIEHLAQDNQYDIDFLLDLARRFGYAVYVDQEPAGSGTREVLRFGPSNALHAGMPLLTYELEWGLSLIDFAPRFSTANQVTGVEVRSWDRETNRAIVERIGLSDVTTNSDLHPLLRASLAGSGSGPCSEREEIVVHEPQFTPAQARRTARDKLSERLKHLVEANGTTIGLPDLRSGQKLRIKGIGARFSGEYFVTKTTHTINNEGYRTKFTARREAGLGGPS